jgi:hypothetical protein
MGFGEVLPIVKTVEENPFHDTKDTQKTLTHFGPG